MSKYVLCRVAAVIWLLYASAVSAHGYQIKKIVIDHPYAVEVSSLPGQYAVYFRTFKNIGSTEDVLIKAETSLASSVVIRSETHTIDHEINWVEIKGLTIAPEKAIVFRHDKEQGYQLLIQGLKKSLKNGDQFPMTLHFKNAGKTEIKVWVQQPRNIPSAHQH